MYATTTIPHLIKRSGYMTKRSRLPWLIIGGIILLVILVAALFLNSPSPQPVPISSPAIISSTDFVAPTAPQPPSCTVAINGQKVPPSSIHLQVMANTCIPGDITGLMVSVNGAQKGMPDASLRSSSPTSLQRLPPRSGCCPLLIQLRETTARPRSQKHSFDAGSPEVPREDQFFISWMLM